MFYTRVDDDAALRGKVDEALNVYEEFLRTKGDGADGQPSLEDGAGAGKSNDVKKEPAAQTQEQGQSQEPPAKGQGQSSSASKPAESSTPSQQEQEASQSETPKGEISSSAA